MLELEDLNQKNTALLLDNTRELPTLISMNILTLCLKDPHMPCSISSNNIRDTLLFKSLYTVALLRVNVGV